MTTTPRTWVVGEVVTAAMLNQEIRDQFNSFFDGWTPYTPTWTAATTNPGIGNGTLTGRYMKIGRTVTCHINLVTGSTTTYGSGGYQFSIPAAAANLGCTYIGNAHLLAGSRWIGHFVISPGASVGGPYLPIGTGTVNATGMTGTSPVTLAAGHQLRITVQYEAAA